MCNNIVPSISILVTKCRKEQIKQKGNFCGEILKCIIIYKKATKWKTKNYKKHGAPVSYKLILSFC